MAFSMGVVVVSAVFAAPACKESEAIGERRVVLFPTLCASHGESFRYRLDLRSSAKPEPCPGEVTTQFTGSAPISSAPNSNCSVDVVVPADATSGPVTITYNGETLTIPRFNIPCGNDPETGADTMTGEDTSMSEDTSMVGDTSIDGDTTPGEDTSISGDTSTGGDTMTDADTMSMMDADAGCTPEGSETMPPGGSPSPGKLCIPGRVYGLSRLGTRACCKLAGTDIVVTAGNVSIPAGIAPGDHTLTCTASGGTTSWPLTVTAGTPPSVTSATVTPATREVTVVGSGFDGIVNVNVINLTTFATRSVALKTNTGTMATLDLPTDLPSGDYEIAFFKKDCGQSNAKFTLP